MLPKSTSSQQGSHPATLILQHSQQWSRAADTSCACGHTLLCQTVSQLWGLEPQACYERQSSKVMGCWKFCYNPRHRVFLLSFPTHCSCQGQGFSCSPQNTNYRLLSWMRWKSWRLKTSLHLKKVEGEEQGRGEGTFAQDFVLKRRLAACACALPCNLKAPEDRTPRSILYWTMYTHPRAKEPVAPRIRSSLLSFS